jgi:hypothetical protein
MTLEGLRDGAGSSRREARGIAEGESLHPLQNDLGEHGEPPHCGLE